MSDTPERIKNYIGGEWVEGQSGDTFTSTNPATGETLGTISRGTEEDVERAVEAAAGAYDQWRKTPAPRRAEILFRAAQLIEERKDEIGRWVTREMGKVLEEGLGDVQEAIDMTYYMAGEGRRSFGQTTPAELPDKFAMSVRDPVGVAGLITPWNFPVAIPSWKTMPALISGNTVIFKPASDTPICAYQLTRVLEEAGVPPGVFNLVYGSGGTVGSALVEHPDVDLISFTGSTDVGTRVGERGAADNKPIHLEMGGKNAITVLDDADLELAVEGIVWSAFGTTGQRCTACSRLIAHEDIAGDLVERLVAAVEDLRLGDGLAPDTDVGPLVNEKAVEKVAGYMDVGRSEGTLAVGGSPAGGGALDDGHFFEPTIFTGIDPGDRMAQEEIFGPVLSVLTVGSLDEAVSVNNETDYGLSSSIYTQDVNRAFSAMRDLTSGLVYVNAGTIGSEVHLPFGGIRGTGNGHREAAEAALDFYTEWKSIYVDYSGRLQRAQIDEFE